MFDNLREQPNEVPFYEDEDQFRQAEGLAPAPPRSKPAKAPGTVAPGRFLGLSPLQRFVLAIMLLIAVCALGSMCLLITGRIGL